MTYRKWYITLIVVIGLPISVWAQGQSPWHEQIPIKEFVPFQTFYDDTQRADSGVYAKPQSGVRNDGEFVKMKTHILSLYEGVEVKNSFILGDAHIDCVDINTQSSLRQNGNQIPLAPPPNKVVEGTYSGLGWTQPVAPMLSRHKKDAYGNVQFCEKGFIPMRRITLDDMTRYNTLDDFRSKYGQAGQRSAPEIR